MKNRAVVGTFALLGAAVVSAPAMAASQPGQTYIAPMGIFTRADADRNSDNGWGGALGIGRVINPWLNVEFDAFGQRFDDNNHGQDWDEYGANINGLFFFSRNPYLSPYAKLGAGIVRTEGDGVDNSIDPAVMAGLGVEHEFTHNGVGLRLEANYRYLPYTSGSDTTDFNEWGIMAGLVIPIGSANQPKPVQPVAVQPLDSDNDGVINANDQCPNTPAGVAVDATGCPLSADADNDGVLNAQDKCPNTRAGAEVNYEGCEILQTRQLNSLHFAFDSAKLSPEGMRYLDTEEDKVNTVLTQYPQATVEIAGYTDSVGTEKYNLGLSQRRTDSVRDYLVSHGVDPTRIASHGYGESDPVASNSTRDGRAQNRRVEVRLIGHK